MHKRERMKVSYETLICWPRLARSIGSWCLKAGELICHLSSLKSILGRLPRPEIHCRLQHLQHRDTGTHSMKAEKKEIKSALFMSCMLYQALCLVIVFVSSWFKSYSTFPNIVLDIYNLFLKHFLTKSLLFVVALFCLVLKRCFLLALPNLLVFLLDKGFL